MEGQWKILGMVEHCVRGTVQGAIKDSDGVDVDEVWRK